MIKKGLKVLVLAGKDKKKQGEIIELDSRNNRAKVKEINMVKKHVKTTKEKKGGIFPKESFIHLSNLKLIDEKAAKKKEAKIIEITITEIMQIISFVFPFSFPILLKSPAFPCPCSKYILLIFNYLIYLKVSKKVATIWHS